MLPSQVTAIWYLGGQSSSPQSVPFFGWCSRYGFWLLSALHTTVPGNSEVWKLWWVLTAMVFSPWPHFLQGAYGAPLTILSKSEIGLCSLKKNVCAAFLCKRRPGRCCLDTERVEFLRHFDGLCGKLGQRIWNWDSPGKFRSHDLLSGYTSL